LFKGGNDSETMLQVLDSEILAPVAGSTATCPPTSMRSPCARSIASRAALHDAKEMAAELEDVLRKHGYAAKNDQIARYMQATFASHIAARKKLLQECRARAARARRRRGRVPRRGHAEVGAVPARASDEIEAEIMAPVITPLGTRCCRRSARRT